MKRKLKKSSRKSLKKSSRKSSRRSLKKSSRKSLKKSSRKSLKKSSRRYILDGDRKVGSFAHFGNKCHCPGCRNCERENISSRCTRDKISTPRERRDQCKQCSRIPLHRKLKKMTTHPNVHKEWPLPSPPITRRRRNVPSPDIDNDIDYDRMFLSPEHEFDFLLSPRRSTPRRNASPTNSEGRLPTQQAQRQRYQTIHGQMYEDINFDQPIPVWEQRENLPLDRILVNSQNQARPKKTKKKRQSSVQRSPSQIGNSQNQENIDALQQVPLPPPQIAGIPPLNSDYMLI